MQPGRVERIDGKYVGFQPQSHEILAALALYSTRFPQDEQQLAKGLLQAVEKAPFLGRFVDMETGQLTDELRTALQRLQEEKLISTEDNSYNVL